MGSIKIVLFTDPELKEEITVNNVDPGLCSFFESNNIEVSADMSLDSNTGYLSAKAKDWPDDMECTVSVNMDDVPFKEALEMLRMCVKVVLPKTQ